MYSEQLAVLLFIAATQVAGHNTAMQPMAQVLRGGTDKEIVQFNADPRSIRTGKQRSRIKREREAMMLAEFR